MKAPFLVVYDYGTGGVWAIINARSREEIIQKYPKLTVVEDRPEWMTDDEYTKIAATHSFDIDGETSGWLSHMAAFD